MNVLALDTSNKTMSVAVMDENRILLAEQTINVKRNHSVQLMPAINDMMHQVGWKVEDLDRVAVAQGPGSYTGVRIAVTVAKSLAWTADLELVGISSLKVLAGNANRTGEHLVAPLFDARRGNVYTGLYQWKDAGELIQVEQDTHISVEKWANYLKETGKKIECIGQDVERHEETLKQVLGNQFIQTSPSQQVPRAGVLAELALSEKPMNIHTFTPEYLKLAEAEEKWKEAHPNHEGGVFVEKI